MSISLPTRVRVAVYLLTALGTPLVAYLNARGVIGDLEVTLWSAEVAAAGALAALKTRTGPVDPGDHQPGLVGQPTLSR